MNEAILAILIWAAPGPRDLEIHILGTQRLECEGSLGPRGSGLKTWTTQFSWITTNKFLIIAPIDWAHGSYEVPFPFLYFITPLENMDHTVFMDYNQQIFENCTKPMRQWVLWCPFSIFLLNYPGIKAKIMKFCMQLLRRGDYMVAFPSILNKSPPWKMGTKTFAENWKPKS